MFISFEGLDCSGKTTQFEKLAAYLKKAGYDVLCTREPGGVPIAERVRALLADTNASEMTAECEMLLFAAARAQHVREKLLPALAAGKIVLCDRFVDSSVAYQGYGRGLGDVVRRINEAATGGLMPEVTFLFDLTLEERARRLFARGAADRLEAQDDPFHARVRAGYLRIAQEAPERVHVLDASQCVDAIFEDILQVLKKHLPNTFFSSII